MRVTPTNALTTPTYPEGTERITVVAQVLGRVSRLEGVAFGTILH
jgi:hypothetical protein